MRGSPLAGGALALVLTTAAAPARAQMATWHESEVVETGDPLGVGVIATPSAAKLGFRAPRLPTDPIALPDGVLAIRYGTMLLVGSALEACAAWAFLNRPTFRPFWAWFESHGDLDLRAATPMDIARVTADARRRTTVEGAPWTLVCWDCTAADVLTGLYALGGHPTTAAEASRVRLRR